MAYLKYFFLFVLFVVAVGSCTDPVQNVDWAEYLGGPDRNHYTTLDQIDASNVNRLQIAWQYNTGDSGDFQCNPIVIDGVLYGISAASNVFAVNAETGEQLWRFVPDETRRFLKNRGVTYWEDGEDRRILCSYDEWLYALDAETGVPVSDFGQDGRVSLKTGLGQEEAIKDKYLMSRTPGAIFEDLIIMPTVMMEGTGSAPGFIQAFNVRTGELAWVFYTIPFEGQLGFDTWPADVHTKGMVGGANNWTGMAVDTERGIVYAPTGSAGQDFFGGGRKGENLFANTLLALDARTGERIWHYQLVRHDIWDRDLPSPPNLMTIEKDGKKIDVVTQMTKNGHIFVFDRDTGEPVYPIEDMEVPASPVADEEAWPTQPVPATLKSISRLNIDASELNTYSPDYDSLKQVYDSANKGFYMPFSDVPTFIVPGLNGGAEWGGAAADPEGILYVNSNEVPWVVTLRENTELSDVSLGQSVYVQSCSSCHRVERSGSPSSGFPSLIGLKDNMQKPELREVITKGKGMMPGFPHLTDKELDALMAYLFDEEVQEDEQAPNKNMYELVEPWTIKGYSKFLDRHGNPGITPPWGSLTAVDLNTGEQKWQIPLGESRGYEGPEGSATGTENYGGPLVTENGLLFIAASNDSKIRAFDKQNGNLLWEGDLPTSGFATPSTYMVDGVQYLVIACGGSRLGAEKGDVIVAFRLGEE
ncbi:MAG TPA: PQQ-binding-like beta-propeller repeat protein [Cyclobacteriaceae bacterium]|nr:PQQ-binding-like beta-propeller repeat protein [Cyclobacteriaceae bacterium]